MVDKGFERARIDQGSILGVVVDCLKKKRHASNLIDFTILQNKQTGKLYYSKLDQWLRMG